MNNLHPIRDYIVPGKRAHLVGIGGVSMCPLAEVLRGMGLHVQGSDMTESDTVRHLRSLGIPVAIGHNAENLGDCDLVVRTAAVHDSNPEIAGAVARGIPVYERAQAWGAIMQRYPNALCVAGTHGKTTTTSMCTHIFMAAEADPTVMIGGTLPLLHAGYRVGQGDTIILESCEYCNSFLSFFPTVAVILNVEEDHLDFFKDLADIQHSFRRFAELVPPAGSVIVNADNASAMEAVAGLEHPTKGEIVIAGKHIEKLNESQLVKFRRERVGFIFQSYNLIATMNALENVALPLSFRGIPRDVRMKKAKEYLKLVGLEKFMKHMPSQMSGGQQQRLCIARALAVEPEVILMDEPTSALDPISTSKIEDLVLELKKDYTIIMVTHNMQQATRVSDRTVFFLLGEVIEDGKTEELFSMPRDKRTEDYITGRFG